MGNVIDIKVTNNATGSLNAGINDSVQTLNVKAGEGELFPTLAGNEYFYCTLQTSSGVWELVKVIARSSDEFTIERAVDGSTAYPHAFSADDIVSLRPVSQIIDDLNAHTHPSLAIDNEADDYKIKARDHGTVTVPETINFVFGTGSTPPAASGTPIGTIYVQYTA
jgi:hypothetical protein